MDDVAVGMIHTMPINDMIASDMIVDDDEMMPFWYDLLDIVLLSMMFVFSF
jgi:hypothetical protein